MGKLSEYESKYNIVKVTVGEMPVVTMTGSLHLLGYLAAVSAISWAKAPPWIIGMITGVWLPYSLLIYFDVRKIGIRARARDRPREPRGSPGGSG